MLAADTNVWARAFINDDASQTRKARSALAEARSPTGCSFPFLSWRSCPGFSEASGREREFCKQLRAFSTREA
jgi:hypothetical protein